MVSFSPSIAKVNSSRSILKAEITLCHCIPHLFQTEKRRKPHFYDSRLFTCSVQYFPLASQSFWTFSLLFSPLYPFSSAQFGISLWFHVHFGLFSCFSLLYVHFHLFSSVFLSRFTFILDFFSAFLGLMSIRKSTEDCGLRKAALRRKRLTIIYRQEKFISQNNSNLPRIQNPESRIWNPECGITPFLFQKLLFRLP